MYKEKILCNFLNFRILQNVFLLWLWLGDSRYWEICPKGIRNLL